MPNTQLTPRQRYDNAIAAFEAHKTDITAGLPTGFPREKFERLCLLALKNPDILQCAPQSICYALRDCATFGLEPNSPLKEAYLVKFKDTCQLIIGYHGLAKLVRQTGELKGLYARCVYEKDVFKVAYGLHRDLIHEPHDHTERGAFKGAYAVAEMRDGSTPFVYLTKAEIDKYRNKSRASGSGPWVTDYEAMACKTVVRRLCESVEVPWETEKGHALVSALAREGEAEYGAPIDVTNSMVDDEPPPTKMEQAEARLDSKKEPAPKKKAAKKKAASKPVPVPLLEQEPGPLPALVIDQITQLFSEYDMDGSDLNDAVMAISDQHDVSNWESLDYEQLCELFTQCKALVEVE